MKKIVACLSAALTAAALTNCSSLPEALQPEDIPDAYVAPQPADMQELPVSDWWENFSSDELTDFMTVARKDNLDLAVYAARIKQAQASTGVAAASLLPTIDLDGTATRTGTKSYTYNTFEPSLGFSYNLDLWGVTRNNWRYARYSALAAIYKRDAAWLTVSSNVANAYLSVLAYRTRITIAKKNVEAAKRILEIARARVSHGAESTLGLAEQTVIVKSEEVIIPALEEKEREARYKLAILLGRAPEKIDVQAKSLAGITPPPVVPGLPSDLLRRRPDIAEAEANLQAAHANLNAAQVAFLPTISLTGSNGFSSAALSTLLDPDNMVWSATASLAQTIFDGGSLTSKRDYYKGVEIELIATYRSTVFNALSDVETALGSVVSLAEQARIKTEQTESAVEAFRISELQYREGVVALLTVLDTQQTLFNAQDELVQIDLSRLEAVVNLYLVLGGGWTVEADKDMPTRNAFVPVPLPVDVNRKIEP